MMTQHWKKRIALLCLVLFFGACQNNSDSNKGAGLAQNNFSQRENSAQFDSCLQGIAAKVELRSEILERKYGLADTSSRGIIKNGQNTVFAKGKEGAPAVLLMHGNLSFPEEMRLLIDELNQKNGMTVLAPLITGFGSSAKVANAARISDWRRSLQVHYDMLSDCFDEVALGGFSLGAALSVDFVLNSYSEFLPREGARIRSLILLSPAIKPNHAVETGIAGFLGRRVDAEGIPFTWLRDLSSGPTPSLDKMIAEPEKYNTVFPFDVASNLHGLSDILHDPDTPEFINRDLQITLVYSHADSATNWQGTRDFLSQHFFDYRTFGFSLKDNLPHGLHIDEDVEAGKKIRAGIARQILLHFHDLQVVDIHSAVPTWFEEKEKQRKASQERVRP